MRTTASPISRMGNPTSSTQRVSALPHPIELSAFTSVQIQPSVATSTGDFFTVPRAGLRVSFVLVVLTHHRRRVIHFNVTEHPTATWAAQQSVDAFWDDSAPAYLLRDRDSVYG